MRNVDIHKDMLLRVASALGPDLLQRMVFVGGCTTSLLVTDEFSREQIRHTDDVDLVVSLHGYAPYARLLQQLRQQGFMERLDNSDPIWAMRLGELRVDIMPDDKKILGFTNRWYRYAVKSAEYFRLSETITIKLINPVYFVATKLEAYLDRVAKP